MSDIEDRDDLEFLRAFEDELYNDTLSIGSNESLDSELEAELYQNVHFASELVETPTTEIAEEQTSDDSSLSPSSKSETNGHDSEISDKQTQVNSVDGKLFHVDKKPSFIEPDDAKYSSQILYPEVELVFSNDEEKTKIHKAKKSKVTKLFEVKDDSDVLTDRRLCDSDEWAVISADLLPAPKMRRSSFRCFNCNERGHRTLECPQPKKEKICWLCGELGHLRKNCRSELCFNCSQSGHQAKKCPKPRCRFDDICNRCHGRGHFESFCPDRWRQYHHTVKEGEIVRGTQNNSNRENIFCYNCGEKGHLGHECLEERRGYSDPCFPFVAIYDRFTSSFAPRIPNRTIQRERNTKAVIDLPRKPKDKRFNETVNKPCNSQGSNQNIDGSGQNRRKAKRSRSKKKRLATEALDEGGIASKRRKVGDDEGDGAISKDHRDELGQVRDQKWNYTEDNYDHMETFTNFDHAIPNLPLQPLMSFDFNSITSKRQRKRKNSQGQIQFESQILETVVKTKKKRLSQKQRRALKNKLLKLEQTSTTSNISLGVPTENGEVKKKKKKRKRNRKEGKINLKALSSTTDFSLLPSSTLHGNTKQNTEHNKRKVVVKETRIKPWKKKLRNS